MRASGLDLSMQRKTQVSSAASSPCVWPRALRPDLAAVYLSTTPGNVETLMRSGELRYKLIAGVRVVTLEELDRYIKSLPDSSGKLHESRQATLARKKVVA